MFGLRGLRELCAQWGGLRRQIQCGLVLGKEGLGKGGGVGRATRATQATQALWAVGWLKRTDSVWRGAWERWLRKGEQGCSGYAGSAGSGVA